MKSNDITKRYRTRFILNILISAFIVCIIEGLLIFNISRLMNFIMGRASGPDTFSSAAVLLFVIAGAGLFALIFYFLERRTIRYITRISEAVEEIADGNFNEKLEIIGDDEFSSMAENINRMTDELQRLLEQERESEKSRNELITNIAHDLKTPLTSIIGYLELLSGKSKVSLNDSQKSKYFLIAYNKSKYLERLITDLFSFTKLSHGKITMKAEYVDIVKLLEQLLEEAYPQFMDNDLSCDFKSNVSSLEITADGELLARLFDNLIGNAIKYGKEGKKIIVKLNADTEADIVEVKVINFGFIIEEKDLPYIFDRFYRADKARSTSTGGTGLGLAIARDITELHGGTISASSDLKGTVFTVRLKIHFDKNREQLSRA